MRGTSTRTRPRNWIPQRPSTLEASSSRPGPTGARGAWKACCAFRSGSRATGGLRSAETASLPVAVTISVHPGVPRVDLRVEVDNRAEDHRLRIMFPTGLSVTAASSEGVFSVDDRPLTPDDPRPTRAGSSRPRRIAEELRQRERRDCGADGRQSRPPEYEVIDRHGAVVAITLLRCVGWLSRPDLRARQGQRRLDSADAAAPSAGAPCLRAVRHPSRRHLGHRGGRPLGTRVRDAPPGVRLQRGCHGTLLPSRRRSARDRRDGGEGIRARRLARCCAASTPRPERGRRVSPWASPWSGCSRRTSRRNAGTSSRRGPAARPFVRPVEDQDRRAHTEPAPGEERMKRIVPRPGLVIREDTALELGHPRVRGKRRHSPSTPTTSPSTAAGQCCARPRRSRPCPMAMSSTAPATSRIARDARAPAAEARDRCRRHPWSSSTAAWGAAEDHASVAVLDGPQGLAERRARRAAAAGRRGMSLCRVPLAWGDTAPEPQVLRAGGGAVAGGTVLLRRVPHPRRRGTGLAGRCREHWDQWYNTGFTIYPARLAEVLRRNGDPRGGPVRGEAAGSAGRRVPDRHLAEDCRVGHRGQ